MDGSFFLNIANAMMLGLISGVVPGLHPIMFHLESPSAVAVMYGVHTAVAVISALYFRAYSPENVFLIEETGVSEYVFGVLIGILLAMVYFPFLTIFSFKLPSFIFVAVLLFVSLTILIEGRRAILMAFLSSILGYVTLRRPVDVFYPLQICVLGMFGGYSLFSSSRSSNEIGDTLSGAVLGFLAGMLVGYFPSMSVSIAIPFFLPFLKNASLSVATGAASSVSLIVSAFAKLSGATRSAFSAELPQTFHIPSIFGFFSLGAVFGAIFTYFLRSFRFTIPRTASLTLMLIFSVFISGISGLCLFVSALSLSLLAIETGVSYKPLLFYFLFPTILYYML